MSADRVVYLDSSALVKLVVAEPESPALLRHLGTRPVRLSSSLARVEVVRAVRGVGPAAVRRARAVLARIDLVQLDDALLDAAADLERDTLRSLDAIHVATALALGEDLAEIVTYDHRMAGAAAALGLAVSAPG
jgi:predicted nucleic acid-binding protein